MLSFLNVCVGFHVKFKQIEYISFISTCVSHVLQIDVAKVVSGYPLMENNPCTTCMGIVTISQQCCLRTRGADVYRSWILSLPDGDLSICKSPWWEVVVQFIFSMIATSLN